jgi:P pilus assembly chaperone PapD
MNVGLKRRRSSVWLMSASVLWLGLACSSAVAGVIMLGTRVIYPGDQASVSVPLRNSDTVPNLVQVWIDDGRGSPDTDGTPVPFSIAPPVFRIGPSSQQNARVTRLPGHLPEDRETLFWFNFQQIPPASTTQPAAPRLELSFVNQVKLIYRPVGVAGSIDELPQRLRFTLVRDAGRTSIKVINPTGFYANFVDTATLRSGEQRVPVALGKQVTIAPFSEHTWSLPSVSMADPAVLEFALISDRGSRVAGQAELAAP